MSDKRLKSWQKATALVPLALLSGAWTASLAATTTDTATAAATSENSGQAGQDSTPSLPDGTKVSSDPLDVPASVSPPGAISVPGLPEGVSSSAAGTMASTASANGIPAVALAAYQRAARVINSADPGCRMPWELLAGIGRVESDHGRYGGNMLNDRGFSVPGVYGIPLDGSNDTAKISDTDGGKYDDDPVYDRAVGAMQFIPSTWSVVGVDADGDGKRDPQDINDAALGSAVYLCSGNEDLSTTGGQRAAVYRYNHSDAYVDLVLSLMRAYQTGDFSAVPNAVAGPTTFAPVPTDSVVTRQTSGRHKQRHHQNARHQQPSGGSQSASGGSASGGDSSSGGSTGSGGGSGGGGSTSPAPGGGAGQQATDKVKDTTDKVKDTTDQVEKTLVTHAKAVQLCTTELKHQFGSAPNRAVQRCADQLSQKTLPQAKASVGGVVSGLSDFVNGLLSGLTGGSGGDGGLTGGGL